VLGKDFSVTLYNGNGDPEGSTHQWLCTALRMGPFVLWSAMRLL
jgi:hypothetical protein